MSKGFGIAALICAIIAVFLPFGIVLSAVAIALAIIAGLAGDKTFTVATSLIAFVNTLFLSPSTWILLGGNEPGVRSFFTIVLVLCLLLPLGAIFLHSAGRFAIKA